MVFKVFIAIEPRSVCYEAFSNIEYKFERNMEIKCVGYPSINVFNDKISLQVQVENGLIF